VNAIRSGDLYNLLYRPKRSSGAAHWPRNRLHCIPLHELNRGCDGHSALRSHRNASDGTPRSGPRSDGRWDLQSASELLTERPGCVIWRRFPAFHPESKTGVSFCIAPPLCSIRTLRGFVQGACRRRVASGATSVRKKWRRLRSRSSARSSVADHSAVREAASPIQ
jgi:hypothetical protein